MAYNGLPPGCGLAWEQYDKQHDRDYVIDERDVMAVLEKVRRAADDFECLLGDDPDAYIEDATRGFGDTVEALENLLYFIRNR